ncbi:putative thioesterase [Chitinophaga dinghuensis]|uniref:Putative thioesterase n=1 Tax=Chitinophaga dinghuensis TaxID=1539050 RepID=A0A327W3A4_9BACT|nr:hotdog domain-containing protein [Chitinophaga dinghuensis]RAJ83272.1 putative thioesterase [Chitinophaga dinghuensis]
MLQLFQPGDTKSFRRVVRQEDCATFESGNVHPVYATFALGRDAEWCCRLFVLEMKEEDEEGIGAALSVEHHSPALVGTTVEFKATVTHILHHTITCSYTAHVDGRLIASGTQVQKILKKDKLKLLFSQYSS